MTILTKKSTYGSRLSIFVLSVACLFGSTLIVAPPTQAVTLSEPKAPDFVAVDNHVGTSVLGVYWLVDILAPNSRTGGADHVGITVRVNDGDIGMTYVATASPGGATCTSRSSLAYCEIVGLDSTKTYSISVNPQGAPNLSASGPRNFSPNPQSSACASINGPNLANGDWTNCAITNNKIGYPFGSWDLSNAKFVNSLIIGGDVDWFYRNFSGDNFAGATILGADMRGNLSGLDFSNSNLYFDTFGSSDGYFGSLANANLAGSTLSSIDFRWTDLSGANLTNISYDDTVIWPQGFTPPPSKSKIMAPSSVTVRGSDRSLKVNWDSVVSPAQGATVTYTATAGSDEWSCTTIETSCDISGLTNGQSFSVTVTANDGTYSSNPSAAVIGMPGVEPGLPTGVGVLSGGGQAQVSWSAPTSGNPLTNLHYTVTSSPGGFTCTTVSLSCMVSGLTNGRTYTFRVVASTVVGTSDPAVSDSIIPGTSPDQVVELVTLARSSSSVTVGWSAPSSNGASISDYLIRISSDNGLTWSEPTDTASTSTSYVMTGLTSATAKLIEVAATNSKGQGPWSNPFLTTTKGAKLVRVTVQDSSGQPVTGGAITWRMSDDSAWSAKTYGLTADGIIDFPYAPAGAVNVSLTNGQMTDGSIVSGSWSSVLGFDTAVLVVPSNASYSARTVHVQLPNGYPVANVKVTVTGNGLTSTRQTGGFSFLQPTSATIGFTDTSGNFTVTGYWDSVPSVKTLYNDGIIVQQQTNMMTDATTNVELDYMPWVSFDSSQVTGDAGAPQVVQVSAVDSESSNLRGRHYLTSVAAVKAGVAVTLVPPKGVKASKCANGKPQKLTGTTGANGKAKLTICAFKSGIYTLKTAGAASVGSIRVLVKGAAPLAPTSVNVTSPVVGQLRASWNKPIYDGGSPITQYTITAQAPGKPTVTKVIKATVNKKGIVIKAPGTLHVLTGLSNATIYTVTITSTTKNGTSDAYTVKVPVA